jgi:hypothetical protein
MYNYWRKCKDVKSVFTAEGCGAERTGWPTAVTNTHRSLEKMSAYLMSLVYVFLKFKSKSFAIRRSQLFLIIQTQLHVSVVNHYHLK